MQLQHRSVLAAIVLLCHLTAVQATGMTESLSFSDRFVIEKPRTPQPDMIHPTFFNLRAPNGKLYPLTADIGTEFEVWLDPKVPTTAVMPGNRSLGLKIKSRDDLNVKDKIVFSPVAHSGPNHIDLLSDTAPHYLAFDFMLDPSYQVPNQWAIHLQVWQCCGGHPPFSIAVAPAYDPNGPVELLFRVVDDAIDTAHYGDTKELYRVGVPRGKWMHLMLELDPKPDSALRPGIVAAWLDCRELFTFNGHWGYTPGTNTLVANLAHAELTSRLGIDIGIYRRRQFTEQTIYIDNVQFDTPAIAAHCLAQ